MDQICGFIGYIPTKHDILTGFVQVIILPKWRGKGLLKKAQSILVKKHHLKYLWATIYIKNIISLKAHLKLGFKYFTKKQIAQWKEFEPLFENKLRLYKRF